MGRAKWVNRVTAPAAIVGVAVFVVAGSAPAVAVLDNRLRRAGRDDLVLLTADNLAIVLAMVSTAIVGAALALRRRRHAVGWLFLGLACVLAVAGPAGGYARVGAVAESGSLPGAAFVAVVDDASFIVWFVLVALILHLTPTGRPLSARWGWAARATVVAGSAGFVLALFADRPLNPPMDSIRNPLAADGFGGVASVISGVLAAVTAVGLVIGATSLVVRFRRSTGVERRQLLWLAVVAVALPVFVGASFAAAPDHPLALSLLGGGFTGLVAVAAGLAITQYHLYDVERILSRALTYLLVSAVLAATYVAVVITAAQVLGTAGGRSAVAAVLATLAAVSVAAPAYRRVQQIIDRRFSRRRFDAVRFVRDYVRHPTAGVDIEDVLGRALGDPTLRVAYWVDDRAQWFSASGQPAQPSADDLIVQRHGRPISSVGFDATRVEREVATATVEEATAELESAGLRAAITLQLVEVRQSRARIAAAQLAERRKIERNLHDGAQQRLLAVALQLQAAQLNGRPDRLRETIKVGVSEIQAAVLELRELANGLHPAVLNDGGLVAALEDLATRTPVPIDVRVTEQRFPPELEATAWFVACEAVTNAVKHARSSAIVVGIERRDGTLVIEVSDDGIGGADPSGSGLRGITDRAEAAGGALCVESRPGRGTLVRAELPCVL